MYQEARLKIDPDALDQYEPLESEKSLAYKLKLGTARIPEFGPIIVDVQLPGIIKKESKESLYLVPYQCQLLWLLIRGQNHSLSSAEISGFIYEPLHEESLVDVDAVISAEMGRLRKNLKEFTDNEVIIQTQYRVGYSIGLRSQGAGSKIMKVWNAVQSPQ